MNAMMRQFGILYQAPARIAAARTEDDLRDKLKETLAGLYRNLLRYELYFRDGHGNLVPAVRLGEGQFGRALKLLQGLRSRLMLKEEQSAVEQPHRLPPLAGVKKGPVMSAPMLSGSLVLGLIVVEAAPGTPEFTAFELHLLEGIAGMCALAIQALRARESQALHAHVEIDLKSASRVQRRMMSQKLPADLGVTVDARYLPAYEVGGDFFEITPLGGGKIGGAIGDVSGKGVSAAVIMSHVASDVRRALRTGASPSKVLHSVNQGLTDVEGETFVTASCIRLDPKARKLQVANAGHIPLIVKRAGGKVFTFGPPSGTPLGMVPCDYVDDELKLDPHDIVLLMTDGLVEALDRPSDRMGLELLLGLIKNAPDDPKLINERILGATDKMNGSKMLDDVTLVALQLQP